jgi:hypothetical protein
VRALENNCWRAGTKGKSRGKFEMFCLLGRRDINFLFGTKAWAAHLSGNDSVEMKNLK